MSLGNWEDDAGIYKDLSELSKSMDNRNPEASTLDTFSLEMFENIAYIMESWR